jgi:hypothetical protein
MLHLLETIHFWLLRAANALTAPALVAAIIRGMSTGWDAPAVAITAWTGTLWIAIGTADRAQQRRDDA